MKREEHNTGWAYGLLTLIGLAVAILITSFHPNPAVETTDARQLTLAAASMPLYFEANRGQASPEVRFLAHGGRSALFLTNEEVVFALRAASDSPAHAIVRMRLLGSNPAAEIVGEEELPGKSNYFVGNDPEQWHINVPLYSRVRYRDLYPGVDMVFYDSGGVLEYDFVVAPGSDPAQIRMQFAGVEGMEVDADGNLILHSMAGLLVQRAPVIYQPIAGKTTEVAGGYALGNDGDLGFHIGNYNSSHALVLDPVIEYARFFGGSKEEEILSLAVDGDGYAYLTGETSSPDLELTSGALAHKPSAFQTEGNTLAFVAKVDPSGTKLIYSTYLGGSKTAVGHNLKIDSSGNAYVGGRTEASDFPTKNPIQAAFGGGSDDGFLTKLNSSGSALVYSTYIGGSEYDQARALAVDSNGNAYLTGITESPNFPTKNPIQANFSGQQDTFALKVNAAGSALVYSTYMGGSGNDVGHAITVDTAGNAFIAGLTNSIDFPTANAYQSAYKGGEGNDVIVVKVSAAGTSLVYSTYLGGSKNEESRAIAVDDSGNATITGYTQSSDFPAAKPLQGNHAGGSNDIFVTQLSADGAALNFSTYLGGSGGDYGRGLALDGARNVYVTGYTDSEDFPTHEPIQDSYAGGAADSIVVKLNPAGSALLFSSYLGGSAYERGRGLAVDGRGSVYISGRTESKDFPVTQSLTNKFGGGPNDAFLVKLSER